MRLNLILFAFVADLWGQAAPRIVTTTVPAECKDPKTIALHGRNYPSDLLQFLPVTIECVTPGGGTGRVLGEATFCGSNNNGTEQGFYMVRLGFRSEENSRVLAAASCRHPDEMRISQPRTEEETAPENERLRRVREGLWEVGLRAEPEWQTVSENAALRVAVERQLYADNNSRFLIHVMLTALSAGPLAVDLQSHEFLIYPNQWQLHRADARPVIAEARTAPIVIDARTTARILRDYQAGRLPSLNERVEYYSAFRVRRPGNADYTGNERYLTVSTDGGVICTDGQRVSSLNLTWVGAVGPRQTDVVLPVPLELKALPADALVF